MRRGGGGEKREGRSCRLARECTRECPVNAGEERRI